MMRTKFQKSDLAYIVTYICNYVRMLNSFHQTDNYYLPLDWLQAVKHQVISATMLMLQYTLSDSECTQLLMYLFIWMCMNIATYVCTCVCIYKIYYDFELCICMNECYLQLHIDTYIASYLYVPLVLYFQHIDWYLLQLCLHPQKLYIHMYRYVHTYYVHKRTHTFTVIIPFTYILMYAYIHTYTQLVTTHGCSNLVHDFNQNKQCAQPGRGYEVAMQLVVKAMYVYTYVSTYNYIHFYYTNTTYMYDICVCTYVCIQFYTVL